MSIPPPLYTPDEAQAEQYFLRGVLGKLRRRKWSVVLVAAALFMALAIGIQALPKTYQGVATVEADAQTTQAVPQSAMLRDQTFSDYTLGSELTILASPELLTATIKRLNLTADPEFNRSLAPPDIIGQVRGKISELIAQWVPNNNPVIIDSADRTLSETVYGLLAHVKYDPIPRSRDIQITVTSRNNAKAALVANTIADMYEANHLEFARHITARAHGFIDANLEKLKADAVVKSQAVAKFKNDNGLITSDASRATTLLQEQTSQASTDLTRVRADLAASEARYQTALHTDPGSLASVLGSPTIQRYRDQEAILGAQLQNLQITYGDNAPQLQKLKAQYGAVRASIAAESRRQVDSLKNDINSQRATVASLTERLATLKSQINNMTTAQASLIPLQGEADAANALYDTYARTVRQTDANMLFPATSVRVVSQAMVPVYPSWPNNMVMLPAAFLLSLGVAGMIGFGREASRKGLVSMNEVESVLDIETLGLLPRITKHNEALYRDAVEQLFNRLWFVDPRPHSILITSARPQEGKSTTARALAVAAAERDIRVLLIDADMRTSRLVNKGVSNLGLGDVLRGHVELQQAVRRDHDSKNLMVLPSGEPRGIPTRLLALDTFDSMFSRLKIDYELIIVDAPPTFVGGDCWLLSQKVDRTVFIAKWGKTTAVDVNEAVRKQLPLANLAGVVLNMVEAKTNMQYGYADSVYLSPQMEQYYKQPKI